MHYFIKQIAKNFLVLAGSLRKQILAWMRLQIQFRELIANTFFEHERLASQLEVLHNILAHSTCDQISAEYTDTIAFFLNAFGRKHHNKYGLEEGFVAHHAQ